MKAVSLEVVVTKVYGCVYLEEMLLLVPTLLKTRFRAL